MKELKIYLRDDIEDLLEETFEGIPILKTITIPDDEDIWTIPLLINSKFYHTCMSYKNNYAVKELEYFKCEEDVKDLEEYAEDNIKCPVCGYEELDSWEYSEDEEEEHRCDHCNSILAWQREHTVIYNIQVKKISEFKKVE
jgi:ribosomal protein L37AE/L43A